MTPVIRGKEDNRIVKQMEAFQGIQTAYRVLRPIFSPYRSNHLNVGVLNHRVRRDQAVSISLYTARDTHPAADSRPDGFGGAVQCMT